MTKMSIGRTIAWLADQAPARPAISHETRTINRLELERRTNRLARSYELLGVGQDDLVTIALPNGIEFYEACIAAWKLGATPQPVSSKLPWLELEAVVNLANPALLIGVEPGRHADRPALSPGFEPDSDLDDGPLPDRIARSWKAPVSGGSTGRPKIIVAGLPGVANPEKQVIRGMPLNGCQLVPGPLYHNGPFAFSMRGLFGGSHLMVLSRFDPVMTLQLIDRYGVDWVLFTPTMMHRIWRLPPQVRDRYNLSSLNAILHTGGPCPTWLKEAWINWVGAERIHEVYGGTELQGITWITGPEWLKHRGSVGKPIGCRMKVLDPDGHELPHGEVGEVFILADSGPGSTYRYIGAEPRALGSWESLGDMGYFDNEGYLYLVDRRTDMIVSGGANVYPAEVEAALESHPKVRSSAVVGLPDDDLGQRVHAIVQGDVTEDALRTYLASRLVRYKIPRSFEFVDAPLRDDAGKVRRSALRQARLDHPPVP
jgi:bile acid-coenzyme A ligase